jgi:KUP system potassium uptake protein
MIGTVCAAAIYNNVSSFIIFQHSSITDDSLDHLSWECLRVLPILISIFQEPVLIYNRVCVMFVTFFDTCMVSIAALIVWKIRPIFVFFPWLTIACLDGVYLSSALTKVPDGAWFTLTLSTVLASLFILWRFGKEQQWQAEAEDRFPTSHLVHLTKDGQLEMKPKYGGEPVSMIKGLGIFFDKGGETTPLVFTQFLSKLVAAPEVMIFFHLRPVESPTIPPENRYNCSRLGIPNCYRLVVRHGYADVIITPNLAALILEQVRHFIITSGAIRKIGPVSPAVAKPETNLDAVTPVPQVEKAPKSSEEQETSVSDVTKNTRSEDAVAKDLARLQEAYDHQILYIIGKEQMRIKTGTAIWRRVLLSVFLWLRENTRTKIANLRVPTERVIEVGFVKDV